MRATALIGLLALSCNDGDELEVEPAPFGDCDPIDEGLCALPWPSTFFMTEDASTPSGWTNDLRPATMPLNRDGVQMAPKYWNEKDGTSTLGPIMFYFRDVDGADLVGHPDVGAYAGDDATIVLIDAETGERVPYFAEVDATAEIDRERLILMRPVAPLRHAHRYVVGVRGLKKTDGDPVDLTDAWLALRDDTPTDTWDIEGRRDYYDANIWPLLEAQGFARSELQIAWDFVTISRESSLGRAEWMRDDAAEREGTDGPDYVINQIQDDDCEAGATIGRTIYGEMTVPLYLEQDLPGSLLTRDDAGQPYYNGDTQVEFMVRVPCSLIEEPRPGLILQYGHGLLGDFGEARTGYLSQMADEYGWVVIATNWKGMAEDDRGAITLMLATDVSDFAMLPERTLQGFVEQDALLRLARGALASDDAVTFDGVSVMDPERFAYYGNSQGGILGAGYSGFSTQLTRAVLGVGGMPYALLLQRSADFDPFFLVFKAKYTDHRDISFLIGAFQTVWDPGEGSGWAWAMNAEPGEGQVAKDVLMQVGIGDAQVSTLGAHIMARAYGAKTIAPETRPIWGVEEAEAPFTGSAIVEWYYPDGAEEPVENLPPDHDADTHECPRREPAAHEQLRDFVETGVINQYCDGICEGVRAETCD
ncbi:MAG: hypothetical protein H6739_28385 [Alphaproteobacteria bacterium]|nr:hypothetical protein [Alphaproteobacteria bacterium]